MRAQSLIKPYWVTMGGVPIGLLARVSGLGQPRRPLLLIYSNNCMWEKILGIAAVVYIAYLIYKWWEGRQHWKKIQNYEKSAEALKEDAEKDLMKLGKEEIKHLSELIESDYLYLKERHKHDQKKLLEFAKDYCDYLEALSDISSARDLFDVDMEAGAHDRYYEAVKEPNIKRYEIEKRFQEILGQTVEDRLEVYFKLRDKKVS